MTVLYSVHPPFVYLFNAKRKYRPDLHKIYILHFQQLSVNLESNLSWYLKNESPHLLCFAFANASLVPFIRSLISIFDVKRSKLKFPSHSMKILANYPSNFTRIYTYAQSSTESTRNWIFELRAELRPLRLYKINPLG